VQITGAAVPNEASSVAVNVTVTGASAGSHVTAFPTGASQPAASTINFAAGATTANLAVVRLGDGGRISLANAVGTTHVVLDVVGHVHVVIDIAGYFDPTAGSRYHALNPSRILDSRTGLGASGPWGANVTREIPRAAATLPADVTAIVSDLTVTDGSHASFVTIFPHGTSLPNVMWEYWCCRSRDFQEEAVGQLIRVVLMSGDGVCSRSRRNGGSSRSIGRESRMGPVAVRCCAVRVSISRWCGIGVSRSMMTRSGNVGLVRR